MTSSNAYILARTCQRLRCALRCYGRCPYYVFTIKKGSKNCQMLKNARSARIANLSVCIDARPAKRAAPSRRATQLPGLLCFCLRRCRCVPYRIRWKCGDNVATGALRSPRSLTHGGAAPQPAAACAPCGALTASTPAAAGGTPAASGGTLAAPPAALPLIGAIGGAAAPDASVGGLADHVYGIEERARLFAESDFVVCALPGTAETADFCGAAEFGAMKETGVFISIGRGLAVDEAALAEALLAKRIAGAALDVFKVEPLPQESKLWECDNLVLTAHNADFTEDYFELGWSVWRANLDGIRAGTGVVTPVSKTAGY